MTAHYTIQIHVAHGDPNGLRIIDRPDDWRGVGVAFRKDDWKQAQQLEHLDRAGVYILWASGKQYSGKNRIYVGQSDNIKSRLKDHLKNKDFWTNAIAFTSEGNLLNAAHIRWLEYMLIQRLHESSTAEIDNRTIPEEPKLSMQVRGTCITFFDRILETLPLAGFNIFEADDDTDEADKNAEQDAESRSSSLVQDTIIVPTGKAGEGFEEVFVGKNCWYYVRLPQKREKLQRRRKELKYILAYRPAPESAITMRAEIADIVPFGDGGKYKIDFKKPAELIAPIKFGDAPSGAMQGPRYTSSTLIEGAKSLKDLLQ